MSKKKSKEVVKGMLNGDIQEWEVHGTTFNVNKQYKVIEPGRYPHSQWVLARTEPSSWLRIQKLQKRSTSSSPSRRSSEPSNTRSSPSEHSES